MTNINKQSKAYTGKLPHVFYEYRNNFVVWIESINKYYILNELAWYILVQYDLGRTEDEIMNQLSSSYRIPKLKAKFFTCEFCNKLMEIVKHEKADVPRFVPDLQGIDTKKYTHKIYKLGNKNVKISYQDETLQRILHPLFSQLETFNNSSYKHSITISFHDKQYYLKVSGQKTEQFDENQTDRLKGRLFITIASILHKKAEQDWMMAGHAAAITKNNKTILIPAKSGSGKTTLAAILKSQGCTVISDDFVPLDIDGFAHYFPAAMSVKSGAVDILKKSYPALESTPYQLQSREKLVRYLVHGRMSDEDLVPRPVQTVLFVHYDPDVPCKLKRLVRFEGFNLLVQQSYIMPGQHSVLAFMQWSMSVKYYELTYSNTEKMLQAINSIL